MQLVARFVGSASSSCLAFSAGERVCASRAYIHARPSLFVFCLHSFTVWHIGLVVNYLRVKGRVKSWFTFSVHFFTHRSEETSGQSGVNWAFFSPSSPFFATHRLGVCACLQRGGVGAQRVKPFWRKPSPTTPLCISEKRHTGEAVKAKNENLLTRAHARAFIFCMPMQHF